VDIPKLDDLLNVVGEMVMTHGQLAQIARELKGYTGYRGLAVEAQKATLDLHRKLTLLREGMIDIRMVPISHIFDRLVRAVQKISRETGKEIDVRVWGGETRMDKAMMEEIVDPLMHLVRNAVDHGIEPEAERIRAGKPRKGMITLSASQRGNSVVIEVEDDGGGMNLQRIHEKGVEDELIQPGVGMEEKDLMKLIFQPGFSTRNHADKISGRGVGLDVVARNVAHLRGMIDVVTLQGKGSKFQVTLPLTLLIIKALIVSVEGRLYAIPINSVAESIFLPPQDIQTVENHEMIHLRGQTLPLVRLKEVFMLQPRDPSPGGEETENTLLAGHPGDDQDKVYVVIVGVAEKRIGIVVDQILEQQEIVIKSLGEGLGHVPGIAGATELGNRKTILALDIGALIEEIFLYSRPHVADLK
jgi:two-component system chemotaxis sensor kinase CheA